MAESMILQTLMGSYPYTDALKQGKLPSSLVRLEYASEFKGSYQGFKDFVQKHRFDFGELAIVTFLMAKSFGTPYVLMPTTIAGRIQHKCLVHNTARGDLSPADLAGKRVAVRNYTQTTAVWVRSILDTDYGVDLNRVTWITQEDGNLRQYSDPPNCQRAAADKTLEGMLISGEVDAAIFGSDIPADPRLKSMIPDALAAGHAWIKKNGTPQINHLAVVRSSLSQSRPDIVRELYRLLLESKKATGPADTPDLFPFGVEAMRKSLELVIEATYRQKIIPRKFAVDELFDDVTRSLGA